MAQSLQRASRSGDLLSHMFVLGKKTIDSVKLLNLWHAGYQRCLFCWSLGDFYFYFPQSVVRCLGSAVGSISRAMQANGSAGDVMP